VLLLLLNSKEAEDRVVFKLFTGLGADFYCILANILNRDAREWYPKQNQFN